MRKALVGLLTLTALGCGLLNKDKDKDKDKAASSASVSAAVGSAPKTPPEPPFEERVAKSTPLKPVVTEQVLAGAKITAEICTLPTPILDKSNMDVFRSVRVIGDRLLVVTGGDDTIRAYKIGGAPKCTLTVDPTWGTNGALPFSKVEDLSEDTAGNLWASTGVFGAKRFDKNGKENGKCESKPLGHLYVAPNGKLGVGTFANANVAKVTLNADGTCKTEAWGFTDMNEATKRKGPFSLAHAAGFVGDTIFVGGSLAKETAPDGGNVVVAVDPNGKEKFRMGKTDKQFTEDRFGWVHGIAGCKKGVCVLDSNYRRITAWSTTGAYVGFVSLSKLFDLKYPWIASFDVDPKTGDAYFVTGQEREGAKNVGEGTIYRVKNL